MPIARWFVKRLSSEESPRDFLTSKVWEEPSYMVPFYRQWIGLWSNRVKAFEVSDCTNKIHRGQG
ncbi:hypothetical protein J28TS4_28500 [Paenibacillus lautus]|nr:hypothetical protein J28TS4_28500 [Paenibacillus lautus]